MHDLINDMCGYKQETSRVKLDQVKEDSMRARSSDRIGPLVESFKIKLYNAKAVTDIVALKECIAPHNGIWMSAGTVRTCIVRQ